MGRRLRVEVTDSLPSPRELSPRRWGDRWRHLSWDVANLKQPQSQRGPDVTRGRVHTWHRHLAQVSTPGSPSLCCRCRRAVSNSVQVRAPQGHPHAVLRPQPRAGPDVRETGTRARRQGRAARSASPVSSHVTPRALPRSPGNCPSRTLVSRGRLDVAVTRLVVSVRSLRAA